MTIIFTKHAEDKFEMLKRHKVIVKRHQVLEAVANPDKLDYSRLPLLIAQTSFDKIRVLRIVYKQVGNTIRIITFYPGRKRQYQHEKK